MPRRRPARGRSQVRLWPEALPQYPQCDLRAARVGAIGETAGRAAFTQARRWRQHAIGGVVSPRNYGSRISVVKNVERLKYQVNPQPVGYRQHFSETRVGADDGV